MEKRKQGPVVITHPDGTRIVFVPTADPFAFLPIDLADGKPYNLLNRIKMKGE